MSNSVNSPSANPFRADAARYNILWRLVPSVNHKLAGSMQPISMLAGMLARHLQRAQVDPEVLIKLAADLQLACKTGIATRADVLAWFQPSENQKVSIQTEVAQCTNMLTAEFAIRGSSIDNQVASDGVGVPQAYTRILLVAVLFGVLDNAPGPVAVQLGSSTEAASGSTIIVSWTDLPESDLRTSDSPSHAVSWNGVEAIADQLGVKLQRSTHHCAMGLGVEAQSLPAL